MFCSCHHNTNPSYSSDVKLQSINIKNVSFPSSLLSALASAVHPILIHSSNNILTPCACSCWYKCGFPDSIFQHFTDTGNSLILSSFLLCSHPGLLSYFLFFSSCLQTSLTNEQSPSILKRLYVVYFCCFLCSICGVKTKKSSFQTRHYINLATDQNQSHRNQNSEDARR